MQKVISSRQLAIMFFLSTLSLRMTVLPSIIYKDVGKEGFVLIVIHCIIELISFFLIYYILKKNQDLSFYKFLRNHLGNFGAKLVFFIIFVFFFFKFLFLIRGGFIYARDVIFHEATLSTYIFIIFTLSAAFYFFKLRAFARTVEIFYPIILIFLIIFLIIPILTTKIYDIRPFFDMPIKPFLNSTFQNLIFSGNFIFALIFMGKIKFDNNKKDFKTIFNIVFISLVILAVFYFIFNSVFKFTGFLHINAISDLVQFVPTPSILGNFDILTISLIKLVFLLYGGLYIFTMCGCVEEIVRVKNIKKVKNRKWILVSVFILVLIFIYFVFTTPDSLVAFLTNYMSYFTIIVFLTLLIIFLITVYIEKGKKNEKNI